MPVDQIIYCTYLWVLSPYQQHLWDRQIHQSTHMWLRQLLHRNNKNSIVSYREKINPFVAILRERKSHSHSGSMYEMRKSHIVRAKITLVKRKNIYPFLSRVNFYTDPHVLQINTIRPSLVICEGVSWLHKTLRDARVISIVREQYEMVSYGTNMTMSSF